MSSNDDYVVNPNTKRPIKRGGRVHLKLIKEGLLENNYEDPNVLYEIEENDNIPDKIQEINEELPDDVQPVRGRGKYKNKLVKRLKSPSVKNTIEKTSKKASKLIAKNKHLLQQEEDDYFNLEQEIENMLLDSMRVKPKQKKSCLKTVYEIQESESSSESSSESDYESSE